eukprot:m.1230411 g.1230411  ORF g.1230411 m.1230411 type:complete len:322 (-) comp24652_c2_seq2:311-1276(-)
MADAQAMLYADLIRFGFEPSVIRASMSEASDLGHIDSYRFAIEILDSRNNPQTFQDNLIDQFIALGFAQAHANYLAQCSVDEDRATSYDVAHYHVQSVCLPNDAPDINPIKMDQGNDVVQHTWYNPHDDQGRTVNTRLLSNDQSNSSDDVFTACIDETAGGACPAGKTRYYHATTSNHIHSLWDNGVQTQLSFPKGDFNFISNGFYLTNDILQARTFAYQLSRLRNRLEGGHSFWPTIFIYDVDDARRDELCGLKYSLQDPYDPAGPAPPFADLVKYCRLGIGAMPIAIDRDYHWIEGCFLHNPRMDHRICSVPQQVVDPG